MYELIHEGQIPAQHVRAIEQHRDDRLVGVALLVPFIRRGDEKIGVIEPVRRHCACGLDADGSIEILMGDVAHRLSHIVYAAGLEVRRQVGDDLGRYIGRSRSGFDASANPADRCKRPALLVRPGNQRHQTRHGHRGTVHPCYDKQLVSRANPFRQRVGTREPIQ